MSDRDSLDRAYANSAHIPGGADFPARWEAEARAFRATARGQLDLPYGPGERQRFDLFLPEAPRGLVVFIHGGYWIEGGRDYWSHLASGALARGWAMALPSYTLAPKARIAQMTAEVTQAVAAARAVVPGPVVVTGHSAGGHLAARMACLVGDLARVVPISPLADLEPIAGTSMNDLLHLDAAEIAAESPYLARPLVPAHVWVGAQERPAFLWQARLLSEAWACNWTPEPGRHHFDVIEGLCDPASPLMQALIP